MLPELLAAEVSEIRWPERAALLREREAPDRCQKIAIGKRARGHVTDP